MNGYWKHGRLRTKKLDVVNECMCLRMCTYTHDIRTYEDMKHVYIYVCIMYVYCTEETDDDRVHVEKQTLFFTKEHTCFFYIIK